MQCKAIYSFVCASCGQQPFTAYGTISGNTALTAATSRCVSKAATSVSKEQFQAEKLYYLSLAIATSMLQKGVIDEAVFDVIKSSLIALP